MKKSGLVRTTLVLLPLQIVFRAGEGLMPFLLAFWFGANRATDVYKFAWAVFLFAGSLVFSAFHDSALVPILSEARLRDRDSVRTIAGSLLAHTWLIGSALAAVVSALALAWFGARYEGDTFHLAAMMVPALAVQLVALSTKTLFAAILSAHHAFVPYPIASAASVIVNLSFIAVTHRALGVLSIPVGTMLGEIVAAAILAFVTARFVGVRPKLTLARPEPVLRFARLVISEVGGNSVTRINPVVDQMMAELVHVAGGLTLLGLSFDVASVPTSLLQASLLSVLLAHLSDDFVARDIARLRATVARAALVVLLLLGGAAVLLSLVREPLLRLVFFHGEMKLEAVQKMAHILPYHLVGLAPFGVLLVLSRAHTAIQNSRIMLAMGILNASMNAGFNLVLIKPLGLEGIALSTSCVHTFVAIVFWILFEKRARALAREAA
jgi:putative peptidoglycan lipid II flippase